MTRFFCQGQGGNWFPTNGAILRGWLQRAQSFQAGFVQHLHAARAPLTQVPRDRFPLRIFCHFTKLDQHRFSTCSNHSAILNNFDIRRKNVDFCNKSVIALILQSKVISRNQEPMISWLRNHPKFIFLSLGTELGYSDRWKFQSLNRCTGPARLSCNYWLIALQFILLHGPNYPTGRPRDGSQRLPESFLVTLDCLQSHWRTNLFKGKQNYCCFQQRPSGGGKVIQSTAGELSSFFGIRRYIHYYMMYYSLNHFIKVPPDHYENMWCCDVHSKNP